MSKSQLLSLENIFAALIPAAMGLATAFGWHTFTPAMQAATTAIVIFAVSTVGVGLTWLHGWRTENYQTAQVAAALSGGLNLVVAFGAASGLFQVKGSEQEALTAMFAALSLAGAFVFAYLKTSVAKKAVAPPVVK